MTSQITPPDIPEHLKTNEYTLEKPSDHLNSELELEVRLNVISCWGQQHPTLSLRLQQTTKTSCKHAQQLGLLAAPTIKHGHGKSQGYPRMIHESTDHNRG